MYTTQVPVEEPPLVSFYRHRVAELERLVNEKQSSLLRLQSARNTLNAQVRSLREELQALQEPAANVGEVIRVMGKSKALIKVNPEGKYCVDVDTKHVDIATLKSGQRVALRSDSLTLFRVLPSKVDPLVSLMLVEKVPDSTYDMIGGLDNQIKEIKEVSFFILGHRTTHQTPGAVRITWNRTT